MFNCYLLNESGVWSQYTGASQVVLVVKNLLVNAPDIRDMGSIPGSGRSGGSFFAWWVPLTGEPGRLQSIGSHRFGLKQLSMYIGVYSIYAKMYFILLDKIRLLNKSWQKWYLPGRKWDFFPSLNHIRASLIAQLGKNLPAMLETLVWSLGWEDPLGKGKATHSSILA